jgi:hypothetical protein
MGCVPGVNIYLVVYRKISNDMSSLTPTAGLFLRLQDVSSQIFVVHAKQILRGGKSGNYESDAKSASRNCRQWKPRSQSCFASQLSIGPFLGIGQTH